MELQRGQAETGQARAPTAVTPLLPVTDSLSTLISTVVATMKLKYSKWTATFAISSDNVTSTDNDDEQ